MTTHPRLLYITHRRPFKAKNKAVKKDTFTPGPDYTYTPAHNCTYTPASKCTYTTTCGSNYTSTSVYMCLLPGVDMSKMEKNIYETKEL